MKENSSDVISMRNYGGSGILLLAGSLNPFEVNTQEKHINSI